MARFTHQSDTTFDDVDHDDALEERAHNTLSGYLMQHDLDVQRTNPWLARSQGLNHPYEE
jgi:hypothetical protein